MAPRLQNWSFTLIFVTVRQRPSREYSWDTISNVENGVLTIKQEKLLASSIGAAGNTSGQPNHVLVIPMKRGQAVSQANLLDIWPFSQSSSNWALAAEMET